MINQLPCSDARCTDSKGTSTRTAPLSINPSATWDEHSCDKFARETVAAAWICNGASASLASFAVWLLGVLYRTGKRTTYTVSYRQIAIPPTRVFLVRLELFFGIVRWKRMQILNLLLLIEPAFISK